jgi:hypothetical protein
VKTALQLNAPARYARWADLITTPENRRSANQVLSIFRDEIAELTTLPPWVGMREMLEEISRELVATRKALEKVRAQLKKPKIST